MFTVRSGCFYGSKADKGSADETPSPSSPLPSPGETRSPSPAHTTTSRLRSHRSSQRVIRSPSVEQDDEDGLQDSPPASVAAPSRAQSPALPDSSSAVHTDSEDWDNVSPSSRRFALVENGCPKELFYSYAPLVDADFDDLWWKRCVALFIDHQANASWKDTNGAVLPSRNRPVEYQVWFKNRRPDEGPPIASHTAFLKSLQDWWRSLQPSCRGDHAETRVVDHAPQLWEAIIKPGRRGIFLILVGLLWVGRAVFEGGENDIHESWSALVEDVAWVLDHDISVQQTETSPTESAKSKTQPTALTDSPSTRKRPLVQYGSRATKRKRR